MGALAAVIEGEGAVPLVHRLGSMPRRSSQRDVGPLDKVGGVQTVRGLAVPAEGRG